MKTITKTINLFSFNELDSKAKEKALENFYDINLHDSWYDSVECEWLDKLEKMGFINPDIRFSGFCCQGDGASFTCSDIDLNQLLDAEAKEKYKEILNDVSIELYRTTYHYCHENTIFTSSGFSSESEEEEKLFVELEDHVLEISRDLMKEIYADLCETHDYLTSEEAIIETIEANEYLFLGSGEFYTG